MSAGPLHSLAVTTSGLLLSWGSNARFSLCTGATNMKDERYCRQPFSHKMNRFFVFQTNANSDLDWNVPSNCDCCCWVLSFPSALWAFFLPTVALTYFLLFCVSASQGRLYFCGSSPEAASGVSGLGDFTTRHTPTVGLPAFLQSLTHMYSSSLAAPCRQFRWKPFLHHPAHTRDTILRCPIPVPGSMLGE